MHATLALLTTAASIGFIHTVSGPDHYVPFIAMSKAGKWSAWRTLWITLACGLGHVMSSVLLASLGLALGTAAEKMKWFEEFRGNVAGWLLLGFGLMYMIWGIRRAIRNQPHTHFHAHENGTVHAHEHVHQNEHVHVHDRAHVHPTALEHQHAHAGEVKANLTPWILFTIFVFGPCEPLIPLVFYPAAKHDLWGALWVTLVFGIVTIATMTTIVMGAVAGLTKLHASTMDRYSHAAAGFALTMCGVAITFLGL